MEPNFTYHSELRNIELDFRNDLYSKVDLVIKSLKLNDIRETELLREQKDILYKKFSLKKVEFSDPKIFDHTEKTVNVGQSYDNFFPYKKNIYEVEIRQGFSGSIELFSYHPNGYNYGENLQYVYIPTSNTIIVYVQIDEMKKDLALAEFNKRMQMTYNFVENNNRFIDSINKELEQYISAKLDKHLESLNNLYS
ncbi:hypothetical protein [Chryseobacterium profundimaris]|uniref:Uncharacterized protein n=1 Tax=Chryseobacterium profundimaris TaxID=1387275 RepID=A0ABY1NSY5_9FLAO|nr:hypothetical protein [Chryseobacterium profundimaris]SMP17324.1 hypothetical protein SAMN06264346_104119 [Chryseobacterium profundimaris]